MRARRETASMLGATAGAALLGLGCVGCDPPPRGRHVGDESYAIASLKAIGTGQELFREGDKEGDGVADYGTLSELSETRMIDEVLGTGSKHGYRFELRVSPNRPRQAWIAVANPVEPEENGQRYFVTNHDGVVFYTSAGPLAVGDGCQIPAHALPVGK